MDRTRREVLAGGAAIAATVASPLVAMAAMKPDWLLAAEADLVRLNWFSVFGPSSALTVTKTAWERGEDGVDPMQYGGDIRCQFAKAMEYGEATMASNGRVHITAHGREVWHEEWLESWG